MQYFDDNIDDVGSEVWFLKFSAFDMFIDVEPG